MKKYIIGFMFAFSVFAAVPTTHAFLGGITSTFNDIGGAVRQVGGIVGGIGGIVNEFRGIFGGGGSGGGSGAPATGLFDGQAARIFEGGLQGGLNVGVDNVVSSGVVVVQDFDALFDSIEGRTGVTPSGQFVLPDPEQFNQIGENTSLRQYILNVLNFALSFLGLVAVAFVIYAGYLYVISNGDDGNMEKAKKIILYAVIGILVILAAFAIVNTVIQNAGRGTGDRGEIPVGSTSTNTNGTISNPNGTITLPNGTVISNGPVNPTDTTSINSNLSNLITVTGAGVQDFGDSAVVTSEAALNGIEFGLNTQAQALFDFGDGTQGILNTVDNPSATISHRYGEERSYSVRVLVENAQGQFPVRKNLVVGGIKAGFSLDKIEVVTGETVKLDATNTTVAIGSVSAYNWQCSGNEGGCFSETFGKQAAVQFSTPGEYVITLEVENVLGVTDTESKTIRVLGGAPTAEFTAKSAGNAQVPGQYEFSAVNSINRSGGTSGLTYLWNFNDEEFKRTQVDNVLYEFTSIGSKKVELVVLESVRGQVVESEKFTLQVDVDTVLPVDFTVE